MDGRESQRVAGARVGDNVDGVHAGELRSSDVPVSAELENDVSSSYGVSRRDERSVVQQTHLVRVEHDNAVADAAFVADAAEDVARVEFVELIFRNSAVLNSDRKLQSRWNIVLRILVLASYKFLQGERNILSAVHSDRSGCLKWVNCLLPAVRAGRRVSRDGELWGQVDVHPGDDAVHSARLHCGHFGFGESLQVLPAEKYIR